MARRHVRGRRRGRARVVPVLPALLLAVGLGVMALTLGARVVTDWRNERAVESVSAEASTMNEATRQQLLANAHAYNDLLTGIDPVGDSATGGLPADAVRPYEDQLGERSGPIGWIEVPKLGLRLLVYRGTDETALAAGVGHLEGTSLPVGGPSTHSVLSAHSGMAASRMFDGIRELGRGDLFAVHVLGEELVYEVTGSEVVLPEEVSSIGVEPGQDLVTLVTCTPYGVNDHRLLVHARRSERSMEEASEGAVASRPAWATVTIVVLAGVVAGAIVVWRTRRRRWRGAHFQAKRGPRP